MRGCWGIRTAKQAPDGNLALPHFLRSFILSFPPPPPWGKNLINIGELVHK
jgi:hypothetical protein